MKSFRKVVLWAILLPYALSFLGVALNQLVILENDGKFPVMMNPKWYAQQQPDMTGMIDDVHCVMTSQTHLNLLADIFNFGGIYSVGDLLIDAGKTTQPYGWFLALCFILKRTNES